MPGREGERERERESYTHVNTILGSLWSEMNSRRVCTYDGERER